jgi:TPR repeat protein
MLFDRTIIIAILIGAMGAAPDARCQSISSANRAYARGDYVKAARSLTVGAERGDAAAQARLGFMYANGYGVPQSFIVAADLYRRSAERGNATAQHLLGLAYDKGQGVPRNEVLAYMWLDLAAAGGYGRERDFYARLRDAVASKMNSAQIAEGQALAVEWTSSPSNYRSR